MYSKLFKVILANVLFLQAQALPVYGAPETRAVTPKVEEILNGLKSLADTALRKMIGEGYEAKRQHLGDLSNLSYRVLSPVIKEVNRPNFRIAMDVTFKKNPVVGTTFLLLRVSSTEISLGSLGHATIDLSSSNSDELQRRILLANEDLTRQVSEKMNSQGVAFQKASAIEGKFAFLRIFIPETKAADYSVGELLPRAIMGVMLFAVIAAAFGHSAVKAYFGVVEVVVLVAVLSFFGYVIFAPSRR